MIGKSYECKISKRIWTCDSSREVFTLEGNYTKYRLRTTLGTDNPADLLDYTYTCVTLEELQENFVEVLTNR